MSKTRLHRYEVTTEWTGNDGRGTAEYSGYRRDHTVSAGKKGTVIQGSSDAAFRGDPSRWSPEELFVSTLSSCHMLWLLHLCADAGIVVHRYRDTAEGFMPEQPDGSARFTEVVLRPHLTITDPARMDDVRALSERAHELCFISRSVNFPVRHDPTVDVADR